MEYNGTTFVGPTRMNSEEPRKLSPTTAGRLRGLSIDRGLCEIFGRCAPTLRFRGLA